MFDWLPILTLTVTRDLLSGQTSITLGSPPTVLNFSAPVDYDPVKIGSLSANTLRGYNQALEWAEPGEMITPPVLQETIRIASANDREKFLGILEDEWEAIQKMLTPQQSAFLLSSEELDSGMSFMESWSSCLVTQALQPFEFIGIVQDTNQWTTITWSPTCDDDAFVYGVFSTDDLILEPWTNRAALWGAANNTSWIDDSSANVDHRFYRVVRIPADSGFNGTAIPSAWAMQYGLNPFDPNLATSDPNLNGLTNFQEYQLGTDPTNATPDNTYMALSGFSYGHLDNLRRLAGLPAISWDHWALMSTQIDAIRSAMTDLLPHALNLSLNPDGMLANSATITTWTLSTMLAAVGNSTGNWLDGPASGEQVAELTDVLIEAGVLVVQEPVQSGYANNVANPAEAPYLVTSFSSSFMVPATWHGQGTIKTYLHFTAAGGYGSSVADDFVKVNGTIVAGNSGCTALPTSFTYDISTLFVTNSSNTIELWDGGTCGGTNNNAYLAPFQIVHVLQVPYVNTNCNLTAEVILSSSVLCGGETTLASAVAYNRPSPLDYTWSTPSGVTNPGNVASFTTGMPGNYIVTITDAVGCTQAASATVSQVTVGSIFSPSWQCPKVPAGTQGILLQVGSSPEGRTIHWYKNGALVGTGGTFSFNASSTTGSVTMVACDSLCTNTCSPPWTVTITDAGNCSVGPLTYDISFGQLHVGQDCPEGVVGYVSFPDPVIGGTACYNTINKDWRLFTTTGTLIYDAEECFTGLTPVPSDVDWATTGRSPAEICEIISDLQGSWTNYYPSDWFMAFAEKGADELLPFFRNRLLERSLEIAAVTIPFDCTTSFDNASALTNLLNNALIKEIIREVKADALLDWGYDGENPQPSPEMLDVLEGCLDAVIQGACEYLENLSPPYSCPVCPTQ
jgi:hypothetical protein